MLLPRRRPMSTPTPCWTACTAWCSPAAPTSTRRATAPSRIRAPTGPGADRDGWELALTRAALARDLPLLAICRGMQVLNVALGGDADPAPARRRRHDRHCPDVGRARPAPGRLAAGQPIARRCSGRAAAWRPITIRRVDRLGDGLSAGGWADDGMVEAVELRRPTLGVRRAVASRGARRRADCSQHFVRGLPDRRTAARRDAAVDGRRRNVEALWARTVFSPVPVRNAFEVTVERLAQSIRLGVLVDGDRLPPERELAETFGVSRVTLREAIKALRDAGLVESRRGRGGGTFVVAPRREARRGRASQIEQSLAHSLDDALALRRVVEPGAAALAASRTLTAADRASLRRYLDEATDCAPTRRGGWPTRGCTWRSPRSAAARRSPRSSPTCRCGWTNCCARSR